MSLQVELLEQSFGKVAPQADEFVMSFYDNLFTDYPAAKPLFEHSDMKKQGQMLKGGLVMVIENLRNPDVLSKALGGLGARHVKYGALPEHYPLVGNSLLKTFDQYLKEDWTEETKTAWVEAYGAITALMLEGADYSSEEVELENAPAAAATSEEEAGLKVSLLEESFGKVAPQADDFVMSFYDNLFTDYPAAKPLFEHSDMKKQGQMLKGGLVMVMENLKNPDVLSKALGGLGARHVKYGALPEHYPLVGNSLLKTFEQYLQADWTEETKAAWVEAYGAITALMLEGADYSSEEVELDSAPAAVPAVPEEEAGLKVGLLEESFGKVAPKADDFVMSFYDNLFTDYPAAKPLFEHTNMKSQGQMLKGGLVMVVENLRKPEVLSKALGGLGARHVKYGALPEHYPLVGNSLLKTFEQYLKDDWTTEVKNAWVEAYGAITALMLEGADYSQQAVELNSAPPAAEPSLPNLTPTAPEAIAPPIETATNSAVSSEKEEGAFPILPVAGGALGLGALILLFILL